MGTVGIMAASSLVVAYLFTAISNPPRSGSHVDGMTVTTRNDVMAHVYVYVAFSRACCNGARSGSLLCMARRHKCVSLMSLFVTVRYQQSCNSIKVQP